MSVVPPFCSLVSRFRWTALLVDSVSLSLLWIPTLQYEYLSALLCEWMSTPCSPLWMSVHSWSSSFQFRLLTVQVPPIPVDFDWWPCMPKRISLCHEKMSQWFLSDWIEVHLIRKIKRVAIKSDGSVMCTLEKDCTMHAAWFRKMSSVWAQSNPRNCWFHGVFLPPRTNDLCEFSFDPCCVRALWVFPAAPAFARIWTYFTALFLSCSSASGILPCLVALLYPFLETFPSPHQNDFGWSPAFPYRALLVQI